MNIPQRWQRSRNAGAKQPASCRYVGRGTNYGNDYQIFTVLSKGHPEFWYVKNNITKYMSLPLSERLAHVHSVDMFKNIQMKIIIGGVPTYYD